MKILIYSHFYYPEVGAASLRMQYFVKALKDNNHEVKVVTPIPNYPHSKVYQGFHTFFQQDKERDITYLPIYIPKNHFFLKRGISYISYAVSSLAYTIFLNYKPDIILASSPPIFTAVSAAVLSKIKNANLILDIRDIWPDIGIELGILKNNLLISFLRKIEKFILNSSTYIIVTAKGDKRNIYSKGISDKKINVIYNGADIELFKPKNHNQKKETRIKFNLPLDKTIIIYFGSFNYGMNDVEILGDVLANLTELKDKIFFIAVGDGDNCKNFIKKIDLKIPYVHLSFLSSEKLADLLPACDLSIIPRKKIEKDTGGNIPVKCFESWAAGVPVLLSAAKSSEIADIFYESNGGKLVEPSNKDLLCETLKEMIVDPKLNLYGEKGRLFMEEKFDRKKQTEKLIELIDKLT